MSSGRRYSVERHGTSIHNGQSFVIPFIECVIGRRNGLYIPKHVLQLSSSERFLNKASKEFDDKLIEILIERSLPHVMASAPNALDLMSEVIREKKMRETSDSEIIE